MSISDTDANLDASQVVNPAISGDGTVVAFCTKATNVAPGEDPNAVPDAVHGIRPETVHRQRQYRREVFLYDFKTGPLEAGSLNSRGERPLQCSYQNQNFYYVICGEPLLNFDGTRLVFSSNANDLVAFQSNPNNNIGLKIAFLRDRSRGKTSVVSYGTGYFDSGSTPMLDRAGERIFFLEQTSERTDSIFLRDIRRGALTATGDLAFGAVTVGEQQTRAMVLSNTQQTRAMVLSDTGEVAVNVANIQALAGFTVDYTSGAIAAGAQQLL